MDFFNELLELYSQIDFPDEYKELSKIDKAISWYLADSTNQYITATKSNKLNILELDIKNAFTTICNVWFDPESDFIKELNKLQEKKSRNIFIATNLKNTEYLKQLNMICKMIIMGILCESGTIQLLELKKDGAIIVCDSETTQKLQNLADNNSNFIQFILNNQFQIKVNEYETYIRCNKTSHFWNGSELETKGTYKYAPQKLIEIQRKILCRENIDHERLLQIFSKTYFDIVIINNLNEVLKEYFLCNNKKYLGSDGKYVDNLKNTIIDPRRYLKTFIYPIILATKM